MRSILKMSLFVVALLFAANTQAQSPLSFGVKAGLGLSSFGGNPEGMKFKPGYQLGFTIDYDIESTFFLHGEIAVVTKGAKSELEKGANLTLSPLYIQLPAHIGYKHQLNNNRRLFARVGPYIAFGISGDYHMKFDSDIYEAKGNDSMYGDYMFQRFDFGAGAAIGMEFNKTVFTFGYDMGLINIANTEKLVFDEGKSIKTGGKDANIKTQNIYLTIGYRF